LQKGGAVFTTEAAVESYIHDLLAKAPFAQLRPFWTNTLIPSALASATQFIQQTFLQVGYSLQQIQGWDYGANFEQSLAAYFAVLRLAAVYPREFNKQAIDLLDVRDHITGNKELGIDPAMIVSGGQIQQPALTTGQVTSGPLNDFGDEFVPYNPCDPRRGRPTQF
jgi:hypothetical protein